jgi:hypothetical protein
VGCTADTASLCAKKRWRRGCCAIAAEAQLKVAAIATVAVKKLFTNRSQIYQVAEGQTRAFREWKDEKSIGGGNERGWKMFPFGGIAQRPTQGM